LAICFHSPLLVLRRPVQRRDTYLDEDSFDASSFFDRVARAASEFPEVEDDPWPAAKVVANRLARAETYYRGANEPGPRRAGKILPGAIGTVRFELDEPLGLASAIRLLLGGLVGVGKSTSMGQGRFQVEGAPVHPRWPPPAAQTFCQRMARDGVL